MAWVTAKEVKALVKSSLTTSELDQIIALAQEEIEAKGGTTLTTNLRFATLYLSVANALRVLKTNGELAYTNKIGVTHQINLIDDMIKKYDELSNSYVIKQINSTLRSTPVVAAATVPCDYYNAEE